jgi:hypothetical protein
VSSRRRTSAGVQRRVRLEHLRDTDAAIGAANDVPSTCW